MNSYFCNYFWKIEINAESIKVLFHSESIQTFFSLQKQLQKTDLVSGSNYRNGFHFWWLNPPINPYLYSPSQSRNLILWMGKMTLIFIYRNKHRNKIISVNKVSSFRTALITETISFLCLFQQLKICLQGQVPRLGGANKVGVYRGI